MDSVVMQSVFSDIDNNKISGAYLVLCDKQSQLEVFATQLLLKLFCENNTSCGVCHKCSMILSDNSPDVLNIKPEKNTIKVDEIRKVNDFLSKKAYEGDSKVVVIYGADIMNINAQNALLKPLENPPQNTYFVLLAKTDFNILPTVVSRCQQIRLLPDGHDIVVKTLVDNGVDQKKAELICNLSSGYLDQAKRLAVDDGYFELRSETIEVIKKFLEQKNYAISYLVDFLDKNKNEFSHIFDIIKTVLMDILKYMIVGKKDIIYNCDIAYYIDNTANNFTIGQIYNMIDRMLSYENRLNYNVNFKLNIESMLFSMLEEKYKW